MASGEIPSLPSGSGALARLLLDRLPEGCLLLDPHWRVRCANPAAARHLGLDPANIPDRRFQDLAPGIRDSHAFTLLRACMSSRISRFFTVPWVGPDGPRVSFQVEPERDGLLVRTWTTPARIRRRLWQPAMADAGDSRFIAHMQAGFQWFRAVRGPDGQPNDLMLLDCNRYFLKYFDIQKEDLVGRLYSALWPEAPPCGMETLLQVASTGVPTHLEPSALTAPVPWEGFAFSPTAGTVALFGVEISACKQAERAVEALNRQLAVRAATLEESVQELDSFSLAIAQDLGGPIQRIADRIARLQTDDQANLSEKGRHYLATLHHAEASLEELLGYLRAFSRSGGQPLQLEWVDLGALVAGALAALGPETRDRNIRWELAQLPVVYGDVALLGEVFGQLLGNAVKFTRQQPEARIQVGVRPDSYETIVFVRDNGAGFDPRQAHRLFVAFQRLHAVGQFQGAGVGLARVKRSIQRHGGRVWAEAPAEGGAIFYLALPRMPDV
jgi:signal transduction histidine kinase